MNRLQFFGLQPPDLGLFALPLAVTCQPMVCEDGREGTGITVTVLCFTFAWVLWEDRGDDA